MSLLVFPLILSPYLTRTLGAEALGRYQYSNTLTLYFCMFCMLGVATYGSRECAVVRDKKDELSRTFWGIYGMQLLASVLVLGVYLAFVTAGVMDDASMALFQLPLLLSYVLDITWLYYGLELFYRISLRNFIIKILSVCMVFALVKGPQDIYRYCLIVTGMTLLSQSSIWPLAIKYVGSPRISLDVVKPHAKQILMLFLPIIAIQIYAGIDKIMIGKMINKTDVAIYAYAENLSKLPVGIVTALTTVMLPRISKLVAENQKDIGASLTGKTMQITMFLAMPIALGIGAIADKMVPWFYAEEFLRCIPLIKMLVIIIIFIAWTYVVQNQCLVPMHMDLVLVKSAMLTAVLNVCANLLLIPKFGIYGATVGTILSEMLVMVYKTFHCRKYLPIGQMIKDCRYILLAALIMYCAVWYTGERIGIAAVSTTLIQIGVGIVTYGVLSVPFIISLKKGAVLAE